MKQIRLFIVAGLLLALSVPAMAASADSPFHMNNRLRIGYDDNINQLPDDLADSSMRIVEQIELMVNLNLERTYLGLRYSPSLIWYENRSSSTDILNDLDFNFTHNFSPALSLSLNDTLRSGQLPELEDGDYIVRENDDNIYNSALATLTYNIRPETRLDASARYITLFYTDDDVSKNNNYYSIVSGLSLRQQLASRTTVIGDFRYQTLTYNEADRDNNRNADSIFGGVGLEQTFNPQLIGNARLGAENRMYENELYDDNTQPYGELSVTYMPSPATRMTASTSYSIQESDVEKYLSQDRTYFSLSVAWDITAKWSVYASSAYSLSAYDGNYALSYRDADNNIVQLGDANEDSILVSMRVTYQLNRINWLEAGWQYVKLDSEVEGRTSYDRNRLDIGWKIQLF